MKQNILKNFIEIKYKNKKSKHQLFAVNKASKPGYS